MKEVEDLRGCGQSLLRPQLARSIAFVIIAISWRISFFILRENKPNQTFKKLFYFWRKLSIFCYTKPFELSCDGPNRTVSSFLLTGACRCQPAYSIICAKIENVNVSKRLELSACLNTDSYRQVFKAVQLPHINGHHLKTALQVRAHRHVGWWEISEIQHQAAQGESASDSHLVLCHRWVCYKKSLFFHTAKAKF